MTVYAVCHLNPRPPHTLAEVSLRGAHNLRTKTPPKVDPTRTHLNMILHGPKDGDISEVLAEKISGQKLRKNARLTGEIILSATRKFFEDSEGKIDQQKVDQWTKTEVDWLKNHSQYGKNLLSIALHLDEETPHIHAMIIPQTQNGKLSYDQFWGSRQLLKTMLDSNAQALAPLGLTRGQEGSHITHDDIRDYRARVAAAKHQAEAMQPEPPIAPDTEKLIQAQIVTEEFTWIERKTGVWPHQAVERIRAREQADREKERAWAIEKIRESAAKGEILKIENQRIAIELRKTHTRAKAEMEKSKDLEAALKTAQKENDHLRPQVERLRKVETVAQGWAQTIVDGNPAHLKNLREELKSRGMSPTPAPTPSHTHSHSPSMG